MQLTIQKHKYKRTLLSNIHIALAIFVMLWLNSGVFSYISAYIPSVVKILSFGIWLLLALYSNKKYAMTVMKIEIPILFLYIIIQTSTLFSLNNKLSIMYLKNIEYIMIITAMSVFYLKYGNRLDLQLICGILVLDLSYIGINTFLKLNQDPMVSRILSTGNLEYQEQLVGISDLRTIGSYTYFYLLVMLVLIVWKYWLDKNNRIILSVILMSCIVLIVKSQFTIALMLMSIFLIKILLETFVRNTKIRFVIIIISVIFILLFVDIIAFLLNKIVEADILGSSIVNERIKDMTKLLKGTKISNDSDITLRLEVYKQSIEAFKKNIIIGSFGEDTVGGHSTFLDFLGLYGMFAILLYVFFYEMYKFIKNNVNDKSILKNVWQYYVILGLINTIIFANIILTIFVLIPIILKLKEKENYEKNTMDS